jgi:hypothetical protein
MHRDSAAQEGAHHKGNGQRLQSLPKALDASVPMHEMMLP